MITEKDFILRVKLYPELYNCYKKDEEKGSKKKWEKFARDNSFKSGAAAESKWRKLVSNYISFLANGTAFAYEQEMQFMQMPLLSDISTGSDDSQSESDIDEVQLKTVLDTYDGEEDVDDDDNDGGPTGHKKQCIDETDDGPNSPNQQQDIKMEKLDDVEDAKRTQSSTVTNHYHDLQKNTEHICADKNDKNLHVLPDDNIEEFETVVREEVANKKGSKLVGPKLEPAIISANISNVAHGATGGFTNLTSLELIFLGYAKVLQRMPLRLQLQTKRKIADIMDEAELQMLEEK